MGADPASAAAALADFAGTGRRFQLRGEVAGVSVIDDYAHHPTEVAAVIAAARAAGAGHLIVLFQPSLFTRTRDHYAGFATALSVADADIVLAPVYGDREDPIEGVTLAPDCQRDHGVGTGRRIARECRSRRGFARRGRRHRPDGRLRDSHAFAGLDPRRTRCAMSTPTRPPSSPQWQQVGGADSIPKRTSESSGPRGATAASGRNGDHRRGEVHGFRASGRA